MSRLHSYLSTSSRILQEYNGQEPLASFLKKFFSTKKQYGSTDRREISNLCYAYFRLGFAAKHLTVNDKLLLAKFLCDTTSSSLMEKYKEDWNEKNAEPLEKKLAASKTDFKIAELFPYQDELSNGIEATAFCTSFLIQPKLFIRLRPTKKNIVQEKLHAAKIPFAINEDCIELSNSTKLDDIIIADKEAVIQDYNSQKVLDYLATQLTTLLPNSQYETKHPKVWDCCAASGGKSILAYDTLKHKLQLTVSDVRMSIIQNLHQRFRKAGIKKYNYFLTDLTKPTIALPQQAISNPVSFNLSPTVQTDETIVNEVENKYDIIICDAPCTGSGTWSRTPEQLAYFKKESIAEFAVKQKQIVANTIPHLQKEGLFIYITCSIFKKENEEVVDFIKSTFKLKLVEQQLLTGYDKKADNMFVAVLQKK